MNIRNLEGLQSSPRPPLKRMAVSTLTHSSALSISTLQNGTDAILTLGTTGESATMTDDEDNSVVAAVVKQVTGRVPVIIGSGSNSTQTMLTKSLTYRGLGADGLLLITPYYNKSNEGVSGQATLRPSPMPLISLHPVQHPRPLRLRHQRAQRRALGAPANIMGI